ncbi:hypothetical protein GCM10028813_14090 [Ramlibacter alkalitolerans]
MAEDGLRTRLVEDLVVEALEALRADDLARRCGGEGRAALGVDDAVGAAVHQQRGNRPAWRAELHHLAFIGDEAREAPRDAVVHQRILGVGLRHPGVVREEFRIEAIADREVGRQPRDDGQQQLLQHAQARRQRRGGQHQAIHGDGATGHQAGRDQAAQAVPQQDQRQLRRALAGAFHDVRQVVEQAMLLRHGAARPTGLAMAVMVVAAHRVTPGIELPREAVVAPRVLAQAVHQQHRGARAHVRRKGPVLHCQVLPVAGRERCKRRLGRFLTHPRGS